MSAATRKQVIEALDLAKEMQALGEDRDLAVVGVAAVQLLGWAICQHQSMEARRALAKSSVEMLANMIELIPIEQ